MFTSIGYLLVFILGISTLVFGLVFLGIGFYNMNKKEVKKSSKIKYVLFGAILLFCTILIYAFFSSSKNDVSVELSGKYVNIQDSNSSLQLLENGTFVATPNTFKTSNGKWQVYENDDQRTIDLLDNRNFRVIQFKVNTVKGKLHFQSINKGNVSEKQYEFVQP